VCGDHLCRRLRLPDGEPTLLDREGGCVTGRVDVGGSADVAVQIRLKEAVRVAAASSSATAWLARSSNCASGRASGVTSASCRPAWPHCLSRVAVISASS
jgi:hypothetical protein